MNRIWRIFIFVSLVAACGGRRGRGAQLNKEYRRINNYLSYEVATDDVDSNMAKLRKILEHELSEQKRDEGFLAATKQLLALGNLKGDVQCNRAAFDILMANNEATGGAVLEGGRAGESRVETLVRACAREHALTCRRQYPEKVAALESLLDLDQRERVESYAGKLVDVMLKLSETELFDFLDRLLDEKPAGKEERIFKYLDVALMALRQQEDSAKLLNAEDKSKIDVDHLFKEYLLQPCEYYVGELVDLFLPAKLDLFGSGTPWNRDPSDASAQAFYRTWAKFEMCKTLIQADHIGLVRRLKKWI